MDKRDLDQEYIGKMDNTLATLTSIMQDFVTSKQKYIQEVQKLEKPVETSPVEKTKETK